MTFDVEQDFVLQLNDSHTDYKDIWLLHIKSICVFLSSALRKSPELVIHNICLCVCLSPISRPLIGRKYRGGGYWGGWACRGPQICCSIKQRKGCAELCHTQIFSLANLWKSHFLFVWLSHATLRCATSAKLLLTPYKKICFPLVAHGAGHIPLRLPQTNFAFHTFKIWFKLAEIWSK